MHDTLPLLRKTDFPTIRRKPLETLQVNLGYRCNQRCTHCHVNAGPSRTEMMEADTVDLVLRVLDAKRLKTLDLTGGAPELHPNFRELVQQARNRGLIVIDRCNLTVLMESGQEDLADFLAAQQVQVVASLPCYLQENVDGQRGSGVFDKSITALRRLNALGYGVPGSGLFLNLVYNPGGAFLPPDQGQLEAAYRRSLHEHHDVQFSQLFALANMPIQRFGSTLVSKGKFAEYMALLKANFSAANLVGLMCRSLISVDWQGYLYDCDFNQMLQMPMRIGDLSRSHLRDLLAAETAGGPIAIADHCYGCAAGQGSSCTGALAA